jgi:photosystem II stability/assembly factor-like uncharacterized protein
MKSKFLLLIVYFLLFANCFPQSGWVKKTIGYNYDYFYNFKFFNQNTGYAISGYEGVSGYNGRFFKTTNSGQNWTSTNFNYPDHFYNGYYFDDANFVLVGNRGNGFGIIAIYSNNVRSDVLISPLIGESTFLYCTNWINSNTGIVAGNDFGPGGAIRRVLKTINHGVNWTDITIPYSVVVSAVYDCKYIDSNTICAIGDMNFIRSTNGGANWSILSSLQSGNTNFIVASKDTFYVYGSQGQFNISIDSGHTWQQRQTGYNFSIGGGAFFNSKTGWTCGNGYIFKTTNAGTNWRMQLYDSTIAITKICILDENNLWVSGNGVVLKTTTGGETFIRYEGNTIVNNYKLEQNYPNPFNPTTNIKFQIFKSGLIELKIFDISGKAIKTLLKQNLNSGEYVISFDAGDFSSGIYFYSLITDGIKIDTKKASLIK